MNTAEPNIIIFLIDAQRADKLSCYGYDKPTTPNIDRIAGEGTLFLNHTTPGVWTLPAHVSLFTGLYQHTHGAGFARDCLDQRSLERMRRWELV